MISFNSIRFNSYKLNFGKTSFKATPEITDIQARRDSYESTIEANPRNTKEYKDFYEIKIYNAEDLDKTAKDIKKATEHFGNNASRHYNSILFQLILNNLHNMNFAKDDAKALNIYLDSIDGRDIEGAVKNISSLSRRLQKFGEDNNSVEDKKVCKRLFEKIFDKIMLYSSWNPSNGDLINNAIGILALYNIKILGEKDQINAAERLTDAIDINYEESSKMASDFLLNALQDIEEKRGNMSAEEKEHFKDCCFHNVRICEYKSKDRMLNKLASDTRQDPSNGELINNVIGNLALNYIPEMDEKDQLDAVEVLTEKIHADCKDSAKDASVFLLDVLQDIEEKRGYMSVEEKQKFDNCCLRNLKICMG